VKAFSISVGISEAVVQVSTPLEASPCSMETVCNLGALALATQKFMGSRHLCSKICYPKRERIWRTKLHSLILPS
jgi:predicted secreted protein